MSSLTKLMVVIGLCLFSMHGFSQTESRHPSQTINISENTAQYHRADRDKVSNPQRAGYTLQNDSLEKEIVNSRTDATNAYRYVVSSTIPKGGVELKLFNNLYTQQVGDGSGELMNRNTFFTTSLSALYGISNRFNAGIDLRYRRVYNEALPSSSFNVFGMGDDNSSQRQGLTSAGLRIRWAPVRKWENFSVQSYFGIPVGDSLEGSSTEPYIDWDGNGWWTQIFNDIDLGSQFSLFTEIDFQWEDIKSKEEGGLNRISTPVTLALNYFPQSKTTIYAITGFSPYWQEDFSYFIQAGLGVKYQITSNFEVEGLYTYFTNDYLQAIEGKASTMNIGLRYSSKRR